MAIDLKKKTTKNLGHASPASPKNHADSRLNMVTMVTNFCDGYQW